MQKAFNLCGIFIVYLWKCYFYVTDGWKVYASFIEPGDHIISKTDMTRVEGENTRLCHDLLCLHRKTALHKCGMN
ncbi:Mobile element protein [Richelia intracellularis]|nr:Mobile element protein [Richelia intracellularis]